MTIKEIAKRAGVSNAAVSRYFNNGYVSEEKREAIHRVVEETGFRPSVQAQMLRTRKTKMIGVIVPKIASTSIGRIVEGILSVLNASGYQMLLAVTENNPAKEVEYLNSLNQKLVDGIVLVATILTEEHKSQLKSLNIPVVIVGQRLSGYCCIYHDDYHAAYDLTRLLLEKGRTRLGYIGSDMQDEAVGAGRYQGYCDAVRDSGHEELAQRIVIAAFNMQSGYEMMKKLLEKCEGDVDAVLCATDTMAAGVMHYLADHSIAVPEQVLVAGHGDSDVGRVTRPPLITAHFSYEESGRLAIKMLLERMSEIRDAASETTLGYYIIDPQR